MNLPVPIAGKTGTTNDARDVWFVGFSSTIVAGCYIGFDTPRSLGPRASGGGLCGPVFNDFMRTAIAEYGGGEFEVPPGGQFYAIDRYSGQRIGDGFAGGDVVYEYFRTGEEPTYGLLAIVDGGFAMGSNLPMFDRGETAGTGETIIAPSSQGTTVTTSTGDAGRAHRHRLWHAELRRALLRLVRHRPDHDTGDGSVPADKPLKKVLARP